MVPQAAIFDSRLTDIDLRVLAAYNAHCFPLQGFATSPSYKKVGESIGRHAETVSDSVRRLEDCRYLLPSPAPRKKNRWLSQTSTNSPSLPLAFDLRSARRPAKQESGTVLGDSPQESQSAVGIRPRPNSPHPESCSENSGPVMQKSDQGPGFSLSFNGEAQPPVVSTSRTPPTSARPPSPQDQPGTGVTHRELLGEIMLMLEDSGLDRAEQDRIWDKVPKTMTQSVGPDRPVTSAQRDATVRWWSQTIEKAARASGEER